MDVLFAPTLYLGRTDNNAFNTDVLIRWGLTDRTDMGLRFNLVGVSSDFKLQLVRAPELTRGLDLAIAPSFGYARDITWEGSQGTPSNSASFWQASLPVLVGINIGQRQLVLTPQLTYQHTSALPYGVLNVGGTIAFGYVSTRGFSVYPVVAIWKAADSRYPFSSLGRGDLAVQPGAVFRWGH
jgi:hypothetical protein